MEIGKETMIFLENFSLVKMGLETFMYDVRLVALRTKYLKNRDMEIKINKGRYILYGLRVISFKIIKSFGSYVLKPLFNTTDDA